MANTTVKLMLCLSMKAMRVMKVIGPDDEVLIRFYEITPEHLIDYFRVQYPKGPEGNESVWSHDARALRKLAEWLHYDANRKKNPVFSEEDLKRVKRDVYAVNIPRKKKIVLTEEFLDRYEHRWLPWLKEHDPILWGPTAFIFYTGLRIHEVAGMDVGLESGTVIRQPDGDVEIKGKADKGIKRFDTITLLEEAEDVLEEWINMSRGLFPDSIILFPSHRGCRLPLQGAFNRNLRRRGKESGIFKGDVDVEGHHATGELKLLRSHVVGRKAFITYNHHQEDANLTDIMTLSRHRDVEVHLGYVHTDTKSSARRVHASRHRKVNGGNSDQVVKVDVKDLLRQLLDLPREEREQLGVMLLRGDPA